MVRKEIDKRIRTLIESGVKQKHRSMFVVVGDKAQDQVPFISCLIVKLPIHFYFPRLLFFTTSFLKPQSKRGRMYYGVTRKILDSAGSVLSLSQQHSYTDNFFIFA